MALRGTRHGGRGRVRGGRDAVHGPLMSAAALLGLIGFVGVPFVYAVVLSFYNVRLGSPRPPEFFGVEQYRRLFLDPGLSDQFLRSLLNTVTFTVAVVPLQTGLALALAVLLSRRLKGIGVFRALFFLPVVFPMTLVAVIWRLILSRSDQGMLNTALSYLTFGHWTAYDWMGSPTTAMASVVVLSVWQGVGFQMVILLAGLQQIPEELYEAARVDRAGRWQQFRHVTLPGIRNTLVFVALLTSVLAFRVFDQIYILIRGGGGLDEKSTRTVMYEAVTIAFDESNIGMASAITVIFFVIVVALVLLQRRVVRVESETG